MTKFEKNIAIITLIIAIIGAPIGYISLKTAIDANADNLKVMKDTLEEEKEMNKFESISTIANHMIDNIDITDLLRSGIENNDGGGNNGNYGKQLLDTIDVMEEAYTTRIRNLVRKEVSALYDTDSNDSKSIRTTANVNILSLMQKETAKDIIDIFIEYENVQTKINSANQDKLTTGRYNVLYILSVTDISIFGLSYDTYNCEYINLNNEIDNTISENRSAFKQYFETIQKNDPEKKYERIQAYRKISQYLELIQNE